MQRASLEGVKVHDMQRTLDTFEALYRDERSPSSRRARRDVRRPAPRVPRRGSGLDAAAATVPREAPGHTVTVVAPRMHGPRAAAATRMPRTSTSHRSRSRPTASTLHRGPVAARIASSMTRSRPARPSTSCTSRPTSGARSSDTASPRGTACRSFTRCTTGWMSASRPPRRSRVRAPRAERLAAPGAGVPVRSRRQRRLGVPAAFAGRSDAVTAPSVALRTPTRGARGRAGPWRTGCRRGVEQHRRRRSARDPCHGTRERIPGRRFVGSGG